MSTKSPGSISSASSVISGSEDHPIRLSKRDRLAAALHQHLPALSLSGRISARIRNETGFPIQIVAWPRHVRFDRVDESGQEADLQMSTHRGTAWEDEVLPADTVIMPEPGKDVEVGTMRKAHS